MPAHSGEHTVHVSRLYDSLAASLLDFPFNVTYGQDVPLVPAAAPHSPFRGLQAVVRCSTTTLSAGVVEVSAPSNASAAVVTAGTPLLLRQMADVSAAVPPLAALLQVLVRPLLFSNSYPPFSVTRTRLFK